MINNRDALNLVIFTVKIVRAKPVVKEYVDIDTGEIFTSDAAFKLGVRVIRPDAGARRREKLDRLRQEPRVFADFMLGFRDGHCGFLVPMEQIIQWFSKMTGKATGHIGRYLPRLIEAGIIDSSTELTKDFMINNPSAGKTEARGNTFKAYSIFDSVRFKYMTTRV